MKTIQDLLRHSVLSTTANVSVLPEVSRAAAEATAGIVPRRNSGPFGHTSGTPASPIGR